MSVTISLRAPEGKKTDFIGASGLLSISMGIDKILMQGICLEKTIQAINNTFGSCDIVISDALQRFNLMCHYPELSENKAYDIALTIGDNWIEKNQPILTKLSIPNQIFRWSDWLHRKDYKNKHDFIYKLFNEDLKFKETVIESTQQYFKRKTKSGKTNIKNIYLENHITIAYNFVLEEAAVMLLWCDAGYDFELHPSKRSPALSYLHDIYYGNKNDKKLKQGRIKILGNHEDFLQII